MNVSKNVIKLFSKFNYSTMKITFENQTTFSISITQISLTN